MPRVENIGKNVDAWYRSVGEGSSTWDVCSHCNDDLLRDPHMYDPELKPYGFEEPDGDDGRGGEVVHPSYDEDINYECAICGEPLTAKDD